MGTYHYEGGERAGCSETAWGGPLLYYDRDSLLVLNKSI